MGFVGQAAGDAFGAIGAQQQRDAEKKMAGIYDKQAITQQNIDNQAAAGIQGAGAAAAGAVGVRATQTIGSQQVGYSSGGVDTQVGTPLEMMASTRGLSALDQATILNNSAKQAWGMKVKGYTDYQQGELGALGAANKADAANEQMIGYSIKGGVTSAAGFLSYGSGGGDSTPSTSLGDFSTPSPGSAYA